MATQVEFDALAARLRAEADEADDTRIVRIIDLIGDAQENVTRRLRQAGDFEARHLSALRREIGEVLGEMESQMQVQINTSADVIAESATNEIAQPITTHTNIELRLPALPRSMLDTYSDFTISLLQNVSDEARAAITREVGLAAVGAKTRDEAIRTIGENLTDRSIFTTLNHRAEAILETEMGRLRSQARHNRMEALAEDNDGLKKYWRTSGDTRVRTSHVLAGQTYTKSRAIGVDEKFRVGGHDALYPRDISLPAGESVRCRCHALLYVPSTFLKEAA